MKNTSIPSFFFELNMNFLDSKLQKKGFELSVKLSPKNQSLPLINRGLKNKEPDWIPVFQGGFESLSQFRYFEGTLEEMIYKFDFKFCIVSTFEPNSEIAEALDTSEFRNYIKKIEVLDPGRLKAPWAPNFLRQVHNTHEGLRLAEDLGFEKAIKIRIDQRFRNIDTVQGVSWLLDEFPSSSEKTKGRVIGSSFNTFKTLPLFLSDCLMFGYTADLIKYWKPFRREDISILAVQLSEKTGIDISLFNHPEVWLAARYLFLNFPDSSFSSQESNVRFWTDLAMVVDADAIRHDWQKQPTSLKTNYKSTKWFEKSLDERFGEMTFWDWVIFFGSASQNRRA
jgi:hypothetical protein